jgi:tetratricopeptide (TPR) repeat protein
MRTHRTYPGLMVAVLALLVTALQVAAAPPEQATLLGTVEFPTSASPQAQAHFLRGVAALHSFWYPVALDEFRAATRVEPNLGYWGEAMAHNHPLWGDPQDTEAARQVLKNITITPQLTPRERAYLHAVQVLYGEGDKPARDKAYAAAMEQIYREYPDDLEAATFYALALLGSVHPDDHPAIRTRMRAAAIVLEVYRKAPEHPGAAHYILHAFDDPDHAILALPAARRYAEIAPAAPHALHMPSHIFLQLGMWPEAAASNAASWAASQQWVQRQNLPISERDYHSLHWWLYVALQQGRYQQAESLLTLMRQSLAAFPEQDKRMRGLGAYLHATMAATFLVETERWEAAAQLLPALSATAGDAAAQTSTNPYQALAALAQSPAIFASGLAAAVQGAPEAQQSMATLRAIAGQQTSTAGVFGVRMDQVLEIQALELAATAYAAQGQLDAALTTMQQAAALEASMAPPPGPSPLLKPAPELYGEFLLRAHRPAEAAQQFASALFRHSNRARALLGAARAAAQSGNSAAAVSAYAQLVQQWQQSDAQFPERQEAQEYLQRVGAVQQAGAR